MSTERCYSCRNKDTTTRQDTYEDIRKHRKAKSMHSEAAGTGAVLFGCTFSIGTVHSLIRVLDTHWLPDRLHHKGQMQNINAIYSALMQERRADKGVVVIYGIAGALFARTWWHYNQYIEHKTALKQLLASSNRYKN